jgi:hypothetical protein
MAGVAELIDNDLELFTEFPIPCSGTAHATDPKLHGNPQMPAEFYVRWECIKCPHRGVRPVCRFFVEHTMADRERVIGCGGCGALNFACDYFTPIGLIA